MKPWKLQKFASDVVYDLRNRNLLSIAIVLVVGILAVPFLISASGSESDHSGAGLTAGNPNELPPEAQAAVLAYTPGVRNYKRRLDALSAKNPFEQQFATPPGGGGSDLGDAAETVTGGDEPTTGGGGGGGGGDDSSGGTTTVKTKTKTRTRYSYYATDVRVGVSGGELTLHRDVDQFDFLPSETAPVLVFLGVVGGGDQAIFLVSKDVSSISGEGVCFPDPAACQLLGLDEAGGADLVYTPDGTSYRVEVAEIERKTSSKPRN